MTRRRRVIELPNVRHAAPIPSASLIDDMLASSAVFGADQSTGEVPEQSVDEIACLFANIRTLVELAGGTTADILRVGVLLRDNQYRSLINEQWIAMFPEESDRPARHITLVPTLPARAQIEFTAVLPEAHAPEGRR